MRLLVLFAEHLDLHALLEQRKRLREVADAHLVLSVHLCILALEVEPLLVALGIGVHFAEQVVLLYHWLTILSLLFNVLLADRLGFSALEITTFDC